MKHKRFFPVLVFFVVLALAAVACNNESTSSVFINVIAPPNGSQVSVGEEVEVRFHAEDSEAVTMVQMSLNNSVVATQQTPLAEGQTPFEGILRWTPAQAGSFTLILTARNANGEQSSPAAVSIVVVDDVANLPSPTPTATFTSEPAGVASPEGGSTPSLPTITTAPGQSTQPTATPTITTAPGQSTQPTATPTNTTAPSQSNQPSATPTNTQAATAPSSTPTRTPEPTNTNAPPPPTYTNTPVPLPEIVAFISDRDDLYPGECVTLQWTTRNATELYLDQWVATIPAGQRVVCYDELAVGTKGFRLTAVNSRDSVSLDLFIEVKPPPETTISPPFEAGMSGSISSDGRSLPFVSPGDDGSNIDYEAFMTFNINGLPANATVTSAHLYLGSCSTNGDPGGLGNHHLVNLQYGDLDAGDYAAGGAYISSFGICSIFGIDVTSFVETMKAESYFQLRLYFDGSDFDGEVDDVTYSAPSMDISYIIQ